MTAVFRLTLAFALTLASAAPALAHAPALPDACAVPGARQIVIGTFRFTATDLQTYQNHHPIPAEILTGRGCDGVGASLTLAEVIGLLHGAASPGGRSQEAAASRAAPPAAARRAVVVSRPVGPVRPGGALEPPRAGGDATCGVVDFWLYAAVDAYDYCNGPAGGNGQAYFAVTRPASFNDADHHKAYASYDEGLEGTCYVCQPPLRRNVVEPIEVPKGDVRPVKRAQER